MILTTTLEEAEKLLASSICKGSKAQSGGEFTNH